MYTTARSLEPEYGQQTGGAGQEALGGCKMGLFSKKLTSAQEKELLEFQNALSVVRWQCEEALWNTNKQISGLYGICLRALQEHRDLRSEEHLLVTRHITWTRLPRDYWPSNPLQLVDTSVLIEEARKAMESYRDFMAHIGSEALPNTPPSWYPRKYRKAHDSLSAYFLGVLPWAESVIKALKPPEPLKHDAKHGKGKLNVFVQGLNLIARSHSSLQQWGQSP